MDSDQRRVFIGGISRGTTEKRLKEYFEAFGDVEEAIIMRDKNTRRGRGFGFVMFADQAVAERVALQRHLVDGRSVEAKKAVPRDEQRSMPRGDDAGPRSRKIYVGGLSQSVTENDFRNYFQQFGTIAHIVLKCDHGTQRCRGFGFITYDSEDVADAVLQNPFHELNGKRVRVEPWIPRDLLTAYGRSPAGGVVIGLGRGNSGAAYVQGRISSLAGGYGVGMNNNNSPGPWGRSGYPALYGATGNEVPGYGTGGGYGSPGFGSTPGYDAQNRGCYGGPVGHGAVVAYNGGCGSTGLGIIPAHGGPAVYGGINAGDRQFGGLIPAEGRNIWGGAGIVYGSTGSGSMTDYGGARPWSPALAGTVHPNRSIVGYARGHRNAESYYGSRGGGYASQNSGHVIRVSPYGSASGASGGASGNVYGSSGHGDSTQRSISPDSIGPDLGGFGFRCAIADRSRE